MRAVNIARLSLASAVVTVALLAGCTNSDTREAAPAETSAAEVETSETPSAEESETPDESATEVEVESDDLTTEPIDLPEGERVQGLYRSTRICFKNDDEIGLWRNYVTWQKYDTKQDGNPAFGEKVCAEGTFVTGDDVEGAIHLVNRDRSNEIIVKFGGVNYVDDDPQLELNGPGVTSREEYLEGESRTFVTQGPNSPRRVLEVARLNNTKWIEFQITARAARTCAPGGQCTVGDVGPGGGLVVFDAGSAQPWGRYLEVAPLGWAGSANDPTKLWCPSSSSKFGSDIGTARDLGSGKANTAAIIEACGTDTAAGIAAAYRGGGKSDWFLPSMNEFNQVWQQRSSNPAFLQPDTNYWTSSQAEVNIPDALKMAIELSNADWDEASGPFFRAQMPSDRHIRPMRAF